MAKLERISLEDGPLGTQALRIDWDNDHHHRVELRGITPSHVAVALLETANLVRFSIAKDEI